MVQLYSCNLVIDNAWLWRADHDVTGLVRSKQNPVDHGIQVFPFPISRGASEHSFLFWFV